MKINSAGRLPARFELALAELFGEGGVGEKICMGFLGWGWIRVLLDMKKYKG